MATAQRRRMRLGELLVAAGVLDETRLNAALAEQRKWGGKLGNILVDMGFLSEDLMVKALSRQLGIPRVDLDKESLPEQITGLLGVDLCERYGVFPVGRDEERRTIRVATSDPTNYQALDAVAFRSNLKVEPVVAAATAIDRAIRRYYYGETTVASEVLDQSRYGLGSSETTYEMDTSSEGPPPSAEPPPPGEALEALQRIDKTVNAQVRALRGLVELLVEQGVIDREAYLAKVRR
jgi:type IV pilus assembly protein PilB